MTIDPGRIQSATLPHLRTAAALHSLSEPPTPDPLICALGQLTSQLNDAASAQSPSDTFDSAVLATIDRIATTSTFGGLLHRKTLCPLAGAAALLLASPAAFSQPRNPFEYNSLGGFNAINDDWTFDTTTGQARRGPWPGADTINGEVRNGAAVFCFDNIYVASGFSIAVQGTRPLVLLSRNSISIQGTVTADGWPGWDANNGLASGTAFVGFGIGGSGIGGAPAVFTQLGGPPPGIVAGGRGGGPGGGIGGTDYMKAGGGSFGGAGAPSSFGTPVPAYGNLFRHLEGGSGGGGAMTTNGGALYGANGGGGIELGAIDTIDIVDGLVTANGGNALGLGTSAAGAGSGGGLFFHARSVRFFGFAQAKGGSSPGGGHGGGGRIAVQSATTTSTSHLSVLAGGPGAQPGVITVQRPTLSMSTVLDFGNVPVGSTKTLALTALNTGQPDSAINALFGAPPLPSPFVRVGTGVVSSVYPGSVGAVLYTFAPTGNQPYSQIINITTNAGNVTVTLTGNGGSGCGDADFNGDGDFGTDADIEAFFRVLAGGNC